jgi:DNA polymerase, archaea type
LGRSLAKTSTNIGALSIERSSPSYIDEAQKELIQTVDEYRDLEAVCEELRSWVNRLERGAVDPGELVITNRVSKKREDYTQSTRTVAALDRAAELGLARAPGQSVSYVVVDDAKQSRERVLLASEELDEYDIEFYRELLVRAAASVLSPFGWREKRIEQELGQYTESSLQSFG